MAAQGSMAGFWHRPDVELDEAWWSPRVYEMLGYEPGEIGPSFSAIVERLHPVDRELYFNSRERYLLHGEPLDLQVRVRHAGGEYRHFRIRALLTRSAGSQPTSLSGSIQDVTELHDVVHKLHVSQARMRDMAMAASDFFFELDEEFTVIWLSDNFRSVTGQEPNPLVGQHLVSRMPDGADPGQWAQYMRHLHRREPFRDLIQKYKNPQGKIVYSSRSGFPVFDGDGEFRGYRGSCIDVTARMEMENALRESEEKIPHHCHG